MFNYDYAINVFYGENFICSLIAKHAGGYDNVIWWQLDELIKSYKDKKISRNLFKTTIEDNSEYFHFTYSNLSNKVANIIDFENQLISVPTCPIYTISEYNDDWGSFYRINKVDGDYYLHFEDGNKTNVEKVEFDESLLRKEKVTFDEFRKINEFYSNLMERDYDFILNDGKVLRFNMA